MASIVTVAELRSILGVSTSLYSDAYLTDVIDTSEAVILPMLVQWKADVVQHICKDDIETIYTLSPHNFSVGQIVDISGVGIHSLQNKTILTVPNDYSFTIAHDIDDHVLENVIPSGLAVPNSPTSYVGVPAVESAVLAVAVEVFQSRIAPGGQIEGIDFTTVSPYRLGRSLFNRVSGLLGQYLDVETMVQ
jgi:hypothetical protein